MTPATFDQVDGDQPTPQPQPPARPAPPEPPAAGLLAIGGLLTVAGLLELVRYWGVSIDAGGLAAGLFVVFPLLAIGPIVLLVGMDRAWRQRRARRSDSPR